MKHINHLFSLFLAITLSVSAWGTDYTIGKDASTRSYTALPVRLDGIYYNKYTISQQIYLASELTAEGASEGDITAIKFYYDHADNSTITRSLEVWIMETALSQFSMTTDDPGKLVCNASYKAGTKVFDGSVTMKKDDYTISFNQNEGKFHWNGSSNIILTVYDKTGAGAAKNRHVIMATANPRFVHKISGTTPLTAWNIDDLYNTAADSYKSSSSEIEGHKWVNKITFTFEGAAVAPATPSGLTASNVGVTTASLAWNSVSDVTSYKLYYSVDDDVYIEFASPTTNSYEWSELTAETTYYVKVAASNAVDDSELSEPISFTTLAPHIHDGITFEPWFNPSAMPTSGDYYLINDVTFTTSGDQNITLTGDLNLCLNGKTANLSIFSITVPSGKTLTIYDNVGGGKLTSFYGAQVGWSEDGSSALIKVNSKGTLVLKEGVIENSYNVDDDYFSYAIYSNGTIRLSGAPVISSNDADIYLSAAGVITIDGVLSNSEKHSVAKYAGAQITSGWSTHMSGEDPRDFFVSADDSHSVSLNEGEAVLISAITLADNVDNSSTMSANYNKEAIITIGRSFSSASYNTICLPFDLSNAQLQDVFGASYDLQEFVGSDMDGETLELSFSNRTALVAGKPYVIQPASNVSNPTFEGVRITATSPASPLDDDNILFKGVLVPTSLTGGNMKQLFLGADNELFYPASTDNLKSFRAYFEIKADVALSPGRIRMAFNSEKAPQGMESVQDSAVRIQKVIRDGKLIIIRDGREYNAQGNLIR